MTSYTVTRDLARLIFQVMINFWSRPGTQLVITTLTGKSGRTRSHITSKEGTRRGWPSVITCWRTIMGWRKWSTPYQKIISCYRSVYIAIVLVVGSQWFTISVPWNSNWRVCRRNKFLFVCLVRWLLLLFFFFKEDCLFRRKLLECSLQLVCVNRQWLLLPRYTRSISPFHWRPW